MTQQTRANRIGPAGVMPHGLMFHHFHGPQHSKSQGSIDAETFDRILGHYAASHVLLDAADYLERARSGGLGSRDVCITFDDSLLCQYDIARPVLDRHGLRAFWFVYSSVINGGIESLEIHRRFRSEHFADIDSFYAAFFDTLGKTRYAAIVDRALQDFRADTYLAEFSVYSDADKRFRYVRDHVLQAQEFGEVMSSMIAAAGTSTAELARGLWMSRDELLRLDAEGHVIGLHSHSHPTTISRLPAETQYHEYAENHRVLSEILGKPPCTMSHPCNSYDARTLQALKALGIDLGFRSNMAGTAVTALEHPRDDHAEIVRRIGLSRQP